VDWVFAVWKNSLLDGERTICGNAELVNDFTITQSDSKWSVVLNRKNLWISNDIKRANGTVPFGL
jgi:hypothetical protein